MQLQPGERGEDQYVRHELTLFLQSLEDTLVPISSQNWINMQITIIGQEGKTAWLDDGLH